jgi:diaminopimelate epimerase
MKFTKMHGIGNDYVYVNCFKEKVKKPEELAQMVSDRHFGIGADGLILICPSKKADVRMRIFNADGSELITDDKSKVQQVCVNMGQPVLAAASIPVNLPVKEVIEQPMQFQNRAFVMTCVSMGNPHAVFFRKDLSTFDVEKFGPVIENHSIFPQRTNAHFVQIDNPSEFTMRTWERGSGITMACGTGACACCVAAVLTKRAERICTAHLPGGDLQLNWAEKDNCVYMTGSAVEVFEGTWPKS